MYDSDMLLVLEDVLNALFYVLVGVEVRFGFWGDVFDLLGSYIHFKMRHV